MSTTPQTFEDLAQVVEHELFPDVDLALRRGRHVDREDAAWYGFLTDAQAHLERFYRRFGAELVQRTDGFFFLLPSGDKLGRRHLSPSEMLVGQGLTLLYLEPATLEQGGVTTREQLLSQLSASMGTEQLMLAFNAKKKRMDERVAQELVRSRVSEAIRRLAGLGFVDLLPEERIRLRASLMRFAEPVRGSGADLEALTRLVASGEVALTDDDDESTDDSDDPATPREAAPRKRPEAPILPEWNEGSEWGSSFDAPPAPSAGESDDASESLDDEAPAAVDLDSNDDVSAATHTEPTAHEPVEGAPPADQPVESDAESDDAEPNDAEPGESDDVESNDVEPGESDDVESDDVDPGESDDIEPNDAEPGEPDDVEPNDAEPGESDDVEPNDAEPVESDDVEPNDAQPVAPSDAEPADIHGAGSDSTGTDSTASDPGAALPPSDTHDRHELRETDTASEGAEGDEEPT